jgi:hypothetical protein
MPRSRSRSLIHGTDGGILTAQCLAFSDHICMPQLIAAEPLLQ